MNFLFYYLSSFGSLIALLFSTFQNQDIHNGMIYIYNTNLPKVIILNFVISSQFMVCNIIIKFLLGEIREMEKLYVIDKVKRKVMELALLLVFFSQDQLDIIFFGQLMILLSVCCIHNVCIKRSEFIILDQNQNFVQHIKLMTLFIILFTFDYFYAVQQVLSFENFKDDNPYILVIFEVLIIFVKTLNPFLKYLINYFEQITLSNFHQKQLIFTVIDFISSIIRIILQISIINFVCKKYGMPLHLIGDLLDNFYNFYKTIKKFYNAINLFRKINSLENITNHDEICLICLSEIQQGKKIDCGHVFHSSCIRSWIQANQNQFCPKCKQKIEIGSQKIQQNNKQISMKDQFYQDQQYINVLYQETKVQDITDPQLSQFQIGSIPYSLPQQVVQVRTYESENIRKNIILRELLMISSIKYPNIFQTQEVDEKKEKNDEQNISEQLIDKELQRKITLEAIKLRLPEQINQ